MFLDGEISRASKQLSAHRLQLHQSAADIRDTIHETVTSPKTLLASFVVGLGAGSIASGHGVESDPDSDQQSDRPASGSCSQRDSECPTGDAQETNDCDRLLAEALAESRHHQTHEWMRMLTRLVAAPALSYLLTHYGPADDDPESNQDDTLS